MKPARFTYRRAGSIDEALALLAEGPETKVLAGGQSLVPLMNMRLARPSVLVDLNPISELATISLDQANDMPLSALRLGAMVRHTDLIESAVVSAKAPLLA